jgi:DNA polymerase (family 10)
MRNSWISIAWIRVCKVLSSAAYTPAVFAKISWSLDKAGSPNCFAPHCAIAHRTSKNGTIAALDELIQLTPAGLFELMRIKGLGGKKLAIIWHVLKIDTMEGC